MPEPSTTKDCRYANQRPKVPVPVVTIATLRKAKGLTLQAICDHINEETGLKVDRGTISAIELGHRRASAQMLAAIADAIGIPASAIDTHYQPRQSRQRTDAVA